MTRLKPRLTSKVREGLKGDGREIGIIFVNVNQVYIMIVTQCTMVYPNIQRASYL